MFFQPNRPRTKAILRTPSWEVKHPSRRLYYVRDCERLHHPSSSRDLTAFLDSVKNTPPTLLKKAGGYWLNISHDSTTMQAPGFYFCYKMLQICSAYSPPFFEKNRGSMRPTFSTTPPPSKFWASTSPVTAASDLSIWRWAFGPASFFMTNSPLQHWVRPWHYLVTSEIALAYK